MPTTSHKIDNRPIGVFDSGLGGLTVVAALHRLLPSEEIIYLGDTARVPYGNRSIDTIRQFAEQDFRFLMSKGVKVVIAACNTVSSVALESLRRHHPEITILGVLEAGVEAALNAPGHRITVIGTKATVNSDAYRLGLHKKDPSLLVESIACPLFVPIAEEGLVDHKIALDAMELYLHGTHPDTLLLGCTHYPLFKKVLSEYYQNKVRVIDSADVCAEYARRYLEEQGQCAAPENSGNERFYVTDYSNDFQKQAERFLGYPVRHVEKVNLA